LATSGGLISSRGVGGEFADGGTDIAHAPERRARVGGAVDEHRQHIVAVECPGQLDQRNGDAVIDLHFVRQRAVEVLAVQKAHAVDRGLPRHLQRAGLEMPVARALRGGADAEHRHQLVEESVEVIRPEHDDQIGLELVQGVGAVVEFAEELRMHAVLRLLDIRQHQRAVRSADQLDGHGFLRSFLARRRDGDALH
jgi:hypothetical protein